jgi:hypothetical protein
VGVGDVARCKEAKLIGGAFGGGEIKVRGSRNREGRVVNWKKQRQSLQP